MLSPNEYTKIVQREVLENSALYQNFFKACVFSGSRRSDKSAERGLFVNLTMSDSDLTKVCNGYPCQKVKFQKSTKLTILYSESEVVDFGMSSIDSNF